MLTKTLQLIGKNAVNERHTGKRNQQAIVQCIYISLTSDRDR